MRRWAAFKLVGLAALGGCVPPIQQPLLGLSGRPCDERPLFSAAIPVPLDRPAGVEAILGADGRCLASDGQAATTYAVFALPPDAGRFDLEIVSRIVPRTIVRPRATLFDGAGKPVRIIEPAEFEANIFGLRAGIRTIGTERWLAVEADRSRLGERFDVRLGQAGTDRIQIAATAPVPIIFPSAILPDVVRQSGGIFSLNGRLIVTAMPAQIAR